MNINDQLLDASSRNDIEAIKSLLDQGADIHVYSDHALRYTSEHGHIEIVKLLIESGADIHAWDDDALRYASINGHIEIVKLLIDHGADIHAKFDEALRLASHGGHIEIVKLLIEAGADIHARSDEALRWAIKAKHSEVVDYLKNLIEKENDSKPTLDTKEFMSFDRYTRHISNKIEYKSKILYNWIKDEICQDMQTMNLQKTYDIERYIECHQPEYAAVFERIFKELKDLGYPVELDITDSIIIKFNI